MPSNSQKQPKKSAKKRDENGRYTKSDAPIVEGVKEIVVQSTDSVESDTTQPKITRNPDKNEIVIN